MNSIGRGKGPTHPPESPLKYNDMYMNGMASLLKMFYEQTMLEYKLSSYQEMPNIHSIIKGIFP